jgi:hypothetical protein
LLLQIAFKFFDQDGSGDVTFDEFKRVFSANLGPDAIPFDFDSAWVKLYLGKVGGQHVLGYKWVMSFRRRAFSSCGAELTWFRAFAASSPS